MGWNFRRSINFGPLRVNLSKSGVGYSVGGRGFRVGKDSNGRKYRSLSIPNTGIYRRDYFPPSTTIAPGPPPAIAPKTNPAPTLPVARPAGGTVNTNAQWGFYIGGAVLLYAVIRFLF
jgi:hypothetical protein